MFFPKKRPALGKVEKASKGDPNKKLGITDPEKHAGITSGEDAGKGERGDPWLRQFAERHGISLPTLKRWWGKFRKEHGIEHVAPGQATQPQREAWAS